MYGTTSELRRSGVMDDAHDKLKAKRARTAVSQRLKAYYASITLHAEEGAAGLLETVERTLAQREPPPPSRPSNPLT